MRRTIRPSSLLTSTLPLSILALCLGLVTPGCKGKEGGEAGAEGGEAKADAGEAKTDGGEAKTDGGEAKADGGEAKAEPEPPAAPINRAEAAAPVKGKGAKGLGFQVNKLTHLFALAGQAQAPEWAAAPAADAGPDLTRDDDLDTAMTCEHGGDKPCVLGLSLPKKAKVEALRLYSAAGPRYRDYTANPRIAKVRVHTDAGFVEATLPDGANHAYVKFDSPIETQSLAIEVVDVHAGKKTKTVRFAELEVYGTDGDPRPALELNPEQAWTSWETGAWSGDGDYTIRQVFIRYAVPGSPVGEEGPATKRLSRATAVFGKDGDNYVLFERMHGTDCTEHEGNYILFDRRNRMLYALGDLGGSGAQVYRHTSGNGFAVGWVEEGRFTVKGIVEEAGELKWKRPPGTAPDDPAAQLSKWGFETKPLGRGDTLLAPPVGCHRGGAGQLAPLQAATSVSSDANLDPSQWLICETGGSTLFAQGVCGETSLAYLLADGKAAGDFEGKAGESRGFRIRKAGNAYLVELSTGNGESSSLYWAEAGTFAQLEKQGALSVRPAAGCAECKDAWVDPEGSGDPDEGEAVDEGMDGEAMDEGDTDDGDEGMDDEGEQAD